MKKSTIIIILIAFVGAIVFISFFGLKAKIYNEQIAATRIDILNETEYYITNAEGEKIKRLVVDFDLEGAGEFTEDGSLTGTYIELEVRVYPDNASNTEVEYTFDKEANPNVEFVVAQGEIKPIVLFKAKGIVTITITSKDGRGAKQEVVLHAY